MLRIWSLLAAALLLVAASPLNQPGVNQVDDPVVWVGTHTNTAQPCFLAVNTVTDSDVTGNNTAVTVDFDTERFDQGADFAADTFTAPVTGRYLFAVRVRASGITGVADTLAMTITTSNRTYAYFQTNTDNLPSIFSGGLSVVADMDAADTATVTFTANGEGADVVDIVGDATTPLTYFSGCLLV